MPRYYIKIIITVILLYHSEHSSATSELQNRTSSQILHLRQKTNYHSAHASHIQNHLRTTSKQTLSSGISPQPYLQIAGVRFLNWSESSSSGLIDIFVPLWSNKERNLVFFNGKINDRSWVSYEGNIYLGYRQINNSQTLIFGVYGAFDRRKTLTQLQIFLTKNLKKHHFFNFS